MEENGRTNTQFKNILCEWYSYLATILGRNIVRNWRISVNNQYTVFYDFRKFVTSAFCELSALFVLLNRK